MLDEDYRFALLILAAAATVLFTLYSWSAAAAMGAM